ncbi:MAG: cytochrome P460 family protein [Myxococcales bacterium]|nr:cytochrome P460 family protein [Myxococcales bacterium]
MDALARGRNALLIAAALLPVAFACAPGSKGPAVGVSYGPAPGGSGARASDAGAPRGPSPIPEGFRATFTKLNAERVVSHGHAGGRFEVDVWANGPAREAHARPSGDYPVGSVLVMEHHERTMPGTKGPTMMMEKREKGFSPAHGDWRYVTVSASGETKKDGAIEACATCHDEAARDAVFPIAAPPAK